MARVEIKPTRQEDYNYVFSPNLEPKARVKPGDDVIIYTQDAAENRINSKEDLPKKALSTVKFLNPQTGPVYIEGAEPGDTLVVKIQSIEFTREFAFSALAEYFGGLTSTSLTPMLQEPLEEEVWIWKVEEGEDGKKYFYEEDLDIRIPSDPFLGTIAVAPDLESISSLSPGPFGGNMDVPDMKPGNIIYLPVFNPGALFFTGDVHGNQGQGEACGFGLEIPAKIHVVFDIIKGQAIQHPRVENDEKIMAVGSARPMEDAARLANIELIKWMVSDYGFRWQDAYQLITQVGGLYVGNMVDTTYSLVASIDKKYLKRLGRK